MNSIENLYHYIWKHSLSGVVLTDIDGQRIEVIDPGLHNKDAGPDFFNSKVKIGNQLWVGNVEIHIKASDWLKHGHNTDPAYENVVLHVVAVSDKRIVRPDGTLIPQVQLTFPEKFFRLVATFNDEQQGVRCAHLLVDLPKLNFVDWLQSLAVERLQQKAERVIKLRNATGGDWEQTCFIMLARGLGFGLNGEPFELLAKSIPLKILHHHSDNPFQLEAILFGQAAMLDPTCHIFDEYYQMLCREYYFLSKKYSLQPLRHGLWKYSRTRPQNFPHRRIAMLASCAAGGFSLFSKLLSSQTNQENIENIFNLKAEGYWQNHYSFDVEERDAPVELSISSRTLLTINVAIPILYAYASVITDYDFGEKVVSMMMDLPAENNFIVRYWKSLGLEAKDAFSSQAILQLQKEYCDRKKCMYCRIGHYFLRRMIVI